MSDVWILLFLLPFGAKAFMIHNTQFSLCLEDSAATGEVLLRKCNLDSESQQWIWINRGMLMSVASSRCLSALDREPVRTLSCSGSEVDVTGLMWDCDRGRLISGNTSMLLSVDGWRLILTHGSKHSKWRSLDEGDICEKLRSRRASGDKEEFETGKGKTDELAGMTDEQREYLRWFYRTEDTTIWTFVLLGLAFVCLLVGFLLLGMGAMSNKNRKKIAKYKAAAAVAQKSEELRIISPLREDSSSKASPPLDRLMQGNKASPGNGEVSELTAGNIMVTWKDGNTSCLYSDHATEEEKQEEVQEEKQEVVQEEKQEEVSAAELEADEAVKTE
ncbi:solute carrier family 51 subunit beta isoform X2 [Centropristis striata]|uniref:solute carrier family 51 subunit beta isoform X2 n=1 Tax=Centropristis striata TaxID=184440 RepID=UPI0027E0C170|nr:solute carrier family 51 subunit beta isoform X2 [Centropristis striata]